MFEDILKLVLAEADGSRAMDDLVRRWRIDRWFSFSGMLKSCEYSAQKMKEYGFDEAHVEKFPADGRTTFGYWRMPYAWDPVDARLTVLAPESHAGKVLAHYRSLPCSLTMWSPATPKSGVEGEVVALERGDRDADYRGVRVRGRFLLTNLRGEAVRNQAIRRGAVGVISDVSRWPDEMPDAVDWMNAWSSDPRGWGLTAHERNVVGFNVSHRAGRELRELIERGPVRLRATVDARIYRGVMPVATGLIRGRTAEEVLTLGHGAEQGAADNASGCACMLEALRVLAELIRRRKLARPRRGIRMLVSWEIYATLAFVETHRPRIDRTVAGLCLDSIGEKQAVVRAPLGLHGNPASGAAFTDTLMKLLAEKVWANPREVFRWALGDFAMTDNVIAEPSVGVPTPLLSTLGDHYWHTSEDTPDKMDVRALRDISAYTATYLYFLADAGEKEAAWLARAVSADHRAAIARAGFELAGSLAGAVSGRDLAARLADARQRIDYLSTLAKMSLDSVGRLLPKRSERVEETLAEASAMLGEAVCAEHRQMDGAARGAASHKGWKLAERSRKADPEMSAAARMIVRQTRIGPIAFDGIPLAKRKGLDDNRWGSPLQTVIRWCNGKRTLAEAMRLASGEMQRKTTGIVPQVRRCAKLGLVKVTRT